MGEKNKKVIFIVGPTSVGKTSFAIELAKRIDGEIISSDSMQAYRHLDIISQKPTEEQRKTIPHHLIDIIEPQEEYSAAKFAKEATLLVDKIIQRKKIPIVVGGSGLYIKALIEGLFPAPQKDPLFRKGLEEEAKRDGSNALHNRLVSIDPEAGSKIHPNDLRRIIRAFEVFHLTGMPISWHKRRTKGIKEDFDIRLYGLIRPRWIIYKRIEERIERMFEEGLVEEVRFIKSRKPSITAEASLGYREVLGYLEKEYSLVEAKRLLKKKTRHFAKRQLTWFKPDKRIRWLELEDISQPQALKFIIEDIRWKRRSPSL